MDFNNPATITAINAAASFLLALVAVGSFVANFWWQMHIPKSKEAELKHEQEKVRLAQEEEREKLHLEAQKQARADLKEDYQRVKDERDEKIECIERLEKELEASRVSAAELAEARHTIEEMKDTIDNLQGEVNAWKAKYRPLEPRK